MIQANTHLGINAKLCGAIKLLDEERAHVTLEATAEMAADDHQLVHGGFIFGLADYAAMLAVNDPNVVLGAAQVKFLAPVKVGDTVEARARISEEEGKKRVLIVHATVNEKRVFEGEFTAFVLAKHVLA
jgi:uncharacterized protein (TIGR00369 family)